MKLSHILGFRLTIDFGKYLGVPLHGRKKKETYAYLLVKTQCRLSGCTLAKAVVAVVAALPTYTMYIVFLQKQLCDKLESMNRGFVWGESKNCKRCHTISWNNFCLSKDVGGMNFRDLHLFNYALIMKLGWGLITN
ncbi:putative ribonuclease H protein, partial [Mucuna pruriens]